jgi:hypothetical protein
LPVFATVTAPLMPPAPFAFAQNSRFVGGGPRLGIDGTIPLGSGWGIEYLGGIAALYGTRSLDVTGFGLAGAAGLVNSGVSELAGVLNLDGQAGLSFRFAQDLKLTAGYRFDGYWGALKTLDAAGMPVTRNRFYGGPTLRLTATTDGLIADPAPPRMLLKAPPRTTPDQVTLWAEGGPIITDRDAVFFGDPLPAGKLDHGTQGAAGFDVRFADTMWHVSADVRYGFAKHAGTFARNGTVVIPSNTPTFGTAPGNFKVPVTANGAFTEREQHEFADFAIGRDVGLGNYQVQIKAGLRIAQIDSKTAGAANFIAPTFYSAGFFGTGLKGAQAGAFSFDQRSRFAGGGPRVGLDGSIPLVGGLTLDYLGGVAVLYGARSLDVTTAGAAATFGFHNFGTSDDIAVLNLDGQAGMSYWLTPALKVSAAYRFDGFWGALKTFDANGQLVNQDRFYKGPTVRVTVKF